MIYIELRNIIEVNYADLERAANLMAAGNSESVMLTDGEYYQKDIANGGINDPYMADALVTWLKKVMTFIYYQNHMLKNIKGTYITKKILFHFYR